MTLKGRDSHGTVVVELWTCYLSIESTTYRMARSYRCVTRTHTLQIANIARIMKNSVPMTSKISKEAKEAVQECISEFISFITSEAAEKCHDEKRKTIGGEDVLYAMMLLGLEQYVEPLKIHLAKMRAVRPRLSRARVMSG